VYTLGTLYSMTTKLIGVKEFRANISDFVKKAQKGDMRFVVVNRTTPLFEIKPFEADAEIGDVFSDIVASKKDIKRGNVYSQDDILAEFAQ
jgi:hypothetical protein